VIYPVDYKKAGIIVDDVRSFVFDLPWLITSNAGDAPHYGTLVLQWEKLINTKASHRSNRYRLGAV